MIRLTPYFQKINSHEICELLYECDGTVRVVEKRDGRSFTRSYCSSYFHDHYKLDALSYSDKVYFLEDCAEYAMYKGRLPVLLLSDDGEHVVHAQVGEFKTYTLHKLRSEVFHRHYHLVGVKDETGCYAA